MTSFPSLHYIYFLCIPWPTFWILFILFFFIYSFQQRMGLFLIVCVPLFFISFHTSTSHLFAFCAQNHMFFLPLSLFNTNSFRTFFPFGYLFPSDPQHRVVSQKLPWSVHSQGSKAKGGTKTLACVIRCRSYWRVCRDDSTSFFKCGRTAFLWESV